MTTSSVESKSSSNIETQSTVNNASALEDDDVVWIPPIADVDWGDFGWGDSIASPELIERAQAEGERVKLFVPNPYSTELVLNPSLFKPLFLEDPSLKGERFKGSLQRCPDILRPRKPSDERDFGESGFFPYTWGIGVPRRFEPGDSTTVCNLFYRAPDLFQEYILDLAKMFPNVFICAYTNVGAYLREKRNKWEAFSWYKSLNTELRNGEMGESYDLEEAFPVDISGCVLPGGEPSERTDVKKQPVLPLVYWSGERMAPFNVPFDPHSSRISEERFFAGNGIGFPRGRRRPSKLDADYWGKMCFFEARAIMRTLKPNHPISIVEMAERLKEGESEASVPFPNERRVRKGGSSRPIEGPRDLIERVLESNFGNKDMREIEEARRKMKQVYDKVLGKPAEKQEKPEDESNLGRKRRRTVVEDDDSDNDLVVGTTPTEPDNRLVKPEKSEMISDIDEIGFGGGGGIPMHPEMRGNLQMSEIVEEKGMECKLGVIHGLSPIQHVPKPSTFKVESTGRFLQKFLGSQKKFDPYLFIMNDEAIQAEEARLKTLSVDFVVAKHLPPTSGERKTHPVVSEMLAKAYNRFLFIARCMERGDERGVWTAIKDGIFATAHDMTRQHDARITTHLGTAAFTSRAVYDSGMIREGVKEKIKRETGKTDLFFPFGGGYPEPPQSSRYPLTSNLSSYNVLPPFYEPDDLVADSLLDSANPREKPAVSERPEFPRFRKIGEGNRSRDMAGSSDKYGNAPWANRRINKGPRGRRWSESRSNPPRGGDSSKGPSGGGWGSKSTTTPWGDDTRPSGKDGGWT
jgi:hypothetical protein